MKSAFLQKGITKAEQSMAKQLADSKGGKDLYKGTEYISSHDATPQVEKDKGIKRTVTKRVLEPMETSYKPSGAAGISQRVQTQPESIVTEREIPIKKGEEGYEWSGSKEIEISAPRLSNRKKVTLVKDPDISTGSHENLHASFQLGKHKGGKGMYDHYNPEGPKMKGSPAKQGIGHLEKMTDRINRDKAKGKGKK